MKTKLLFAALMLALPATVIAADDTNVVKRAFMKANDTMMEMMHMAPTGYADKDFVAMMIPHHQGAIDMAKIELQYGHDEKLKALAKDIVAAQEKEIAEMKAWQKANP